MAETVSREAKGPARRLIFPAAAAAIAFAILVSLGVWQLNRLAWKEGLIARVEAGLAAAPVPAPGPAEWPTLDVAAAEYRPVTVSGRYDNAHEAHVVYALTEPKGPVGGFGYMVMTPFVTDDGWIVYVNRGFVPTDRKDPATRAGGLVDGPTSVVGLLRGPQDRSWFSPADQPSANAWFSRDPALFAAAAGIAADRLAPYIIDARFDPNLPGGLPQGGETVVTFPNDHLQYALTWFGLAAVLVAVFAGFVVKRIRMVRAGEG